MTGQNTLSDILRFQCPACSAVLTVPSTLAGVEGPCPSCFQTITAPIAEATYEAPYEMANVPWITPGGPPQEEFSLRSTLAPAPAVKMTELFSAPQEKSFRAKLAIPTPEEPLDDSWKARHRDIRRQTRRVRKTEEVAHTFLESRAFGIARVVLIFASAGMLVWLFTYMQSHQWRLPGMPTDMARDKPGATSGASHPLGTDANIFTADDDIEIPPASNTTPGTTPSARPLAGTPR